MSYNHHQTSYIPSYSSNSAAQNTGAAYMARRGWEGVGNVDNSLTFSSKSSSKRVYITAFIMLSLLLLTAIIIIILFAVGVIGHQDTTIISPSPLNPNPNPNPAPNQNPIVPQQVLQTNSTFSGSFTILRQASEIFDLKNTNTYFSSLNLIQNAIDNIMVSSTLQPYAAKATITNLQNVGNDLNVQFRIVTQTNGADQNFIANVLRSNINRIEGQLGGNAQIDPNSVSVLRIT
ncbi:unnamed protein product [Caenorhabditis angaria]|uniref:SEA domain-containing protein n=1 Tax=Caenorhabditis angaria TaxID=860376 RepID=A0A9P1J026_9PELO|nr:unnamed protein product [Caenorhabditis angaria]